MRTLSRPDLNRTFLTRQMLLKRQNITTIEATERLVGLQAQIPNPPYIGLWTRLENFQRETLTQLMEERKIVRAALLRSTLHLMTAEDHHRFQPVLQTALTRALNAFFGRKAKALDVDMLVTAAKPFLEEAPRTTGELKKFLLEIAPQQDGDAMAYAIRNNLPLVQVPPGGAWGTGSRASYTTAEQWLGPMTITQDLRTMFFRYLTAFGPAGVMDFQAWSGMTRLKTPIEKLRAELVVYQSEDGKELFDLPDMPIIDADTPTPVRFIPEYDNLLVSHQDRRRIIADEDRPKVFLSAARVLATVLVHGFVAGTWKTERTKDSATLIISPFKPFSDEVRQGIVDEGEQLIRFIEDDADDYVITFVDG